MDITFDCQQRHALVTGGAQGIGFSIAREFLGAGAAVTIWDRDPEALAHAEQELGTFRERLTVATVDCANPDSCAAAAQRLRAPLNVLVNNAGITRDRSFAKLSDDDLARVIEVNLLGAMRVTKALLNAFEGATGPRRIVNMASVVALYGNFGQTNYAASKAGLIGFTKALARELGRKGFTVNALAPGFIRTRMVEAMPKDVVIDMEAKIPLGRLGRVEDIAQACLFLASDAAAYINGAVINVDGGLVT